MTVIEGKGIVPPSVVRVGISNNILTHLQEIAKKRDEHRKYKKSSSKWRVGSTENPILMGLVGEFAFQDFLQKRGVKAVVVDDSLNDGDGGRDAVIAGVSYQVKTSARAHKTCLVRRVSESKRIVTHVCQRFVFCRWSYGESVCDIRGWCNQETLRDQGEFKKDKKGAGWFNTELDTCFLDSMANLVLLIKQELGNV